MQRNIGLLGLTFVAVSGTLGSGWLFAPLLAAQMAGPAAVLAWVLGGLAVLLLAVTYAEISTLLPVAGGIGRIPHFSHGSVVSVMMGWTAWVGYTAGTAVEVEAILRYSTGIAPWLYNGTKLTLAGQITSCALLAFFVVVNAIGVRFFTQLNTGLTWIKIFFPALLVVVIVSTDFNTANFGGQSGFAPAGAHGILTAVSAGGVVFSLIGFRQIIDMAGEAKNPKVNIPLALVFSIVICVLIYAGLQVAFVGAVDVNDLANGWSGLHFPSELAPMALIATAAGGVWLGSVMNMTARLSSFAAGLVNFGSTARLGMAMAHNGLFPPFMQKLSSRGVPLMSLAVSYLATSALFFALPFNQVVTLTTASLVLSFAAGPVSVVVFRKLLPDAPRSFKLPFVQLTAGAAFVVATLIIYWTGWASMLHLSLSVLAGLGIMLVSRSFGAVERLDWRSAAWLGPYIAGIIIFSYLGSFGGGTGILPMGVDMAVIAVFAVIIFIWAVRSGLSQDQFDTYMRQEQRFEVIEYGRDETPDFVDKVKLDGSR
ncbi:APC family permease [Roseibium sp. RKSG952]|uniref:APC family permease n=1 Tax=Roseibium sp. RKSG952 TaxID=2529384 RepID=UPI0012BC739B|nr:APC family permease [Roseibium sp. RKSG952]MTH99463.1 APC family permease [Roseibium sp. RKSG952]